MALLDLPEGIRARLSWPDLDQLGDAAINLAFDPRVANAAQLLGVGLPLRPDRVRAPKLYALWEQFLARKQAPAKPQFQLDTDVVHLSGEVDSGAMAIGGRGRWRTSRNWSGAVIGARDGKLFTTVAASWIVPSAEKVDSDAGAVLSGSNRQCSVWIGLDGHRRYSISLPQVGTRSLFDPAKNEASYHLWVQWWVRGEMFGEVKVVNFEVRAGDEIHAILDVLGPTSVRFTVQNRSRDIPPIAATWDGSVGEITGTDVASDGVGNLMRANAPVEGRHAVFCVERPSVMPPESIQEAIKALVSAGRVEEAKREKRKAIAAIQPYSLAQFHEGTFREALAQMHPRGIRGNACEERDLTGARYIRMIDTVPGRAGVPRIRRLTSPVAPCQGGGRVQVNRVRNEL
jgi:hypothetical protein